MGRLIDADKLLMERLTEKQSSGYDLKAMNGEWCNKYCEKQIAQTCNECGIYQAIQKLAEYEDFEEIFRAKCTDTVCEFLKDKEEFSKWLDRIEWIAKKCDEYARAEEQGLLLRLSCKVGDIVYEIHPSTGKITERKIKSIVVCNCPDLTIMYKSRYDYSNVQDDFGKTVFLTQVEAEQKLKEMEV